MTHFFKILCYLFLGLCIATTLFAEEATFAGKVVFLSDYYFEKAKVGGLSGITYDAKRKLFYAIADHATGRQGQCLYTLKLVFKQNRLADVKIVSLKRLCNNENKSVTFVDTEGIAFDGRNGFWISNEGDRGMKRNPVSWVRHFNIDTAKETNLRCILPQEFLPNDGNDPTGLHPNRGLESLAFSPDFRSLYTMNERPLYQDGDKMLRLVKFSSKNGVMWKPEAEKPYCIENKGIYNSVTDMTTLPDGKLLVLERSIKMPIIATGQFNFCIYEVNFKEVNVPDILGVKIVTESKNKALTCKLIFDSAAAGLTNLDNIEGMCLGPVVGGRQSLILVADNNFSTAEETQFLMLLLPQLEKK